MNKMNLDESRIDGVPTRLLLDRNSGEEALGIEQGHLCFSAIECQK
jgi:hypothetical protein